MKSKEKDGLYRKVTPFALMQTPCRNIGYTYQEGEKVSWKTFGILMDFADSPMLNGIFKLMILAFECLMWFRKKDSLLSFDSVLFLRALS